MRRIAEFDRQPTLQSEVVHLRPLDADDRDALFAVASDPLIWATHPDRERGQKAGFDRFFDQSLRSGGALVAFDPRNGQIIGSSRYDLERAGENEIEIGWTFLARDRWGSGVNPEMKRLMMAHAFRRYERCVFFVWEENQRSRRAVESIGGVLTQRLHSTVFDGQERTHVVYAIDRASFAARFAASAPIQPGNSVTSS